MTRPLLGAPFASESLPLGEKGGSGRGKDRTARNPMIKKVLIVDDRADNRFVLKSMLSPRGYRLMEAGSGAQALEIVQEEKPDLVIADVLMSKMDGYEFVRQLRLRPEVAHTTVVFLHCQLHRGGAHKLAQACGIHHIIVKPTEPEEVFNIVDRAFAGRAGAEASVPAPDFVQEHLHLITDKLSEKVFELEKLNKKLEAEIAQRKRVAKELRLAHEQARRAREDAERASHAKDNFIATLSHELRTPLTPVLMCAAALEQELAIEPQFRQQLAMMRRNIELEARLIDDLLDLTKVTHGKLQLVRSGPVDVHSLLKHTEQIVRMDAREKFIELHFVLEAAERHVVADAPRLHQVFWNLLKNAIKFTPVAGHITVRTGNPTPGQLVLIVADTGIGIDPQTLPVIFRAFEQGNRREVQSSGGLGLGLSISKAIVELHGGTISAESAGPGLGSIFTVQLTTVLPFPGAETSEMKSQQPEASSHRLRLLVIEDHEPTLVVLTRLLRQQGYDVLSANTVNNALLVARTHTFDVVISDIGLPDGNGIDLMRQLTQDYGLRGIALSGYGMAEDRAKTQQAGFLAHLIKPINFEQLHHVIQQVVPAVHAKAERGSSSGVANRRSSTPPPHNRVRELTVGAKELVRSNIANAAPMAERSDRE